MKLQRYYSQGFGESDDGDMCWAEDVEYLEAVNAELLAACKSAFKAMKDNDWNERDSVFVIVQTAIAKAEGGKP